MIIGELKILTWNPAKELGDELYSGSSVRIEALGTDWVILRTTHSNKALSATFNNNKALKKFWSECESYE